MRVAALGLSLPTRRAKLVDVPAAAAVLILTLWAIPAQAQSDRAIRLSFAAAVVGHSADVATSCYCLGAGTCRETNPLLQWAEDKPLAFGMSKMAVASASLLATHALARRGHRKLAFALNLAQAVTFTAIAIRNSRTGG